MSKSTKMPSISASLVLIIETPTIEESLSAIVVKKKYFANVQSFFTGQKR